MSKQGEKKCCLQLCKPLTTNNLAFHYLPLFGAVNYATLSVNVMHPSLIARLCPARDVTNVLLANSVVGTTLYIYSRPHLKHAPTQTRLLYSGFSAVMFNFGSVLVWAVLRTVTKSQCIATLVGLLSGFGMVAAGKHCLQYIDSQVETSSSS
ncbi:uncharacterized protein LOC106674077 [Cimex lectularius]|uniref:Uncharacterized protein n=1 Tax=Cimex lectularius TaxID=79782 RepID=A0A8I6SBK7_CIMLE|nr:uncharacterized protein LOC106674077 [Cimex lectularius]